VTPPSRGKRAPEPTTGFPATGSLATGSLPIGSLATGSLPIGSPATGSPPTDSLATEASLVGRAQTGDVDAFERLSSAYADRVFMLLLRLLGDRGEAEDVAQEVMLRAWQGIAHFQGRSSYFTWLYRIAVNEASRALEKRGRRPAGVSIGADELQLPASPALEPSRQAEASELRAILGRALADLPPPLRTAIVLRDVEGLSTQEAAEITGVSQAAFKSRLHQARLRVRAAVGDDALVTAGH
jgi:RNA polymerase sigma-70 factor (ECF subfamily)